MQVPSVAPLYMQLNKLEIKYNTWGEHEGKYTGTIIFKDERKTEIIVVLEPELAAKYVQFSAPILMQAADNAAERFKKQLEDILVNDSAKQLN